MSSGLYIGNIPISKVNVGIFSESGIVPTGTKNISNNGTHDVTEFAYANVQVTPTLQEKFTTVSETSHDVEPDDGYDGLSVVHVGAIAPSYVGSGVQRRSATTYTPGDTAQTIPSGIYLSGAQTIAAVPTETKSTTTNGTVTPSTGKYLSSVTVNVQPPLQSKTVTSNGTVEPDEGYYGLSSVEVSVSGDAPTYQTKTVTPSETAQQVKPDTGYDALSQVNVNAISSTYVGSGIARKSSSDLTASGATITAPAGYYSTSASKSVASGSVTVDTPTISNTGRITASATLNEGYVSGVLSSKFLQLPTTDITSITPSKTSAQTAISAGTYATHDITVNKIPDNYIDTSDADAVAANILVNKTAYVNGEKVTGSMTNRGAGGGTITGKSQVVTIPSGYYDGTGTVSISSTEANKIISDNIKSGVTILGVQGSYSGSGGIDTSDADAVAADILLNKTAYVDGVKITGEMPEVTLADPTISTQSVMSATTGAKTLYIDAAYTNTAGHAAAGTHTTKKTEGYVTTHGLTVDINDLLDPASNLSVTANGEVDVSEYSKATINVTPNLETSITITPSKTAQTRLPSYGYDGIAKVVVNSIPSEYITTTDATAAQADIVSGKTAYVNGSKVTGNLVIQKYYTGSSAPASSLGSDGDLYLQA